MLYKLTSSQIIVLLTLALIVVNSATAKDTLVIGKVSDNPKKHYRYLKPMVDYVAGKMQDLGIKQGKVLMAKNNQQMIRYLKQGKVDWVTETVFSSVVLQNEAGAEIMLRKWKKGVPDYYSLIFVRKDSGIHSLQDLKGRTIGFEDPGSTSAYYIPASVLIRNNLELYQLNSPREKSPADKVGYVFTNEEINTSTMVYKGLIDAGAFNNLDWEKENHNPELFRNNIRVIYKTKRFPRALEVVRKNLEQKIKQRLKELLLKAHEDPDAKSALRLYQKTKKFDELNDKIMESIEEARKLEKIVSEQVK